MLKTDGPFAETREQLGGFILIEASDMEEAMHVASKIPLARLWSVEVRPIKELKNHRGLPTERHRARSSRRYATTAPPRIALFRQRCSAA